MSILYYLTKVVCVIGKHGAWSKSPAESLNEAQIGLITSTHQVCWLIHTPTSPIGLSRSSDCYHIHTGTLLSGMDWHRHRCDSYSLTMKA